MNDAMHDEWRGVDYELVFEVATGMPRMHEHLVDALAPAPGERWLDLATGTGRVALIAATRGARVIGLDLSPSMLETARRRAAEAGLEIRFDLGDSQELPYQDSSFDVVSSAVGVIFAPDPRAIARELARVCRPGGRIGIVAWRPDDDFAAIFEPFAAADEHAASHAAWGREEDVGDLLGDTFELRFEDGDAPMTGVSGEAIWDVWVRSIGSTRRLHASLEPARAEELRQAFVTYFERFRGANGIEQPNPYLVILGTRR